MFKLHPLGHDFASENWPCSFRKFVRWGSVSTRYLKPCSVWLNQASPARPDRLALYWKVYIHSNQCHENTSGQRLLPRASAECCCHIASGNLITIGTSSSEQRRANRASKGRRCHGTQPFSTHAPTFEPASQNHSRPASASKGRASKGYSMWLSSSRRPSALNIRRPTLMARSA